MNTKHRGENIFKCEAREIHKNAHKAIKMKADDQSLPFSIAIDGTKVTQSLSTSDACKFTMGGTYPNHIINAINIGKECDNKTLENKEKPIALAQEAKVATMRM